jgi:hypothetical protein
VTLALPELSVVAVPPLERPALAPEPGAPKETVTFGTELPYWSVTVACNMVANCVPTFADCGVPAVAVTVAADAVVLVSAKVAEPPIPETEAVTL